MRKMQSVKYGDANGVDDCAFDKWNYAVDGAVMKRNMWPEILFF
jgi:hypothetical protein